MAEVRPEGFYWWHDTILRDLRRLRDEHGKPAYNVPGLASNAGFDRLDAEKYAAQLLSWGMVIEADPLWDFDATWIALPA